MSAEALAGAIPLIDLARPRVVALSRVGRMQARLESNIEQGSQFLDGKPFVFCLRREGLEAASLRGEVTMRALARGAYPGARLPEGLVPGVRSVGYWDAKRPQLWGLDWHRNEGIEITFLERGSLAFATRGQDWLLHPGQFTVTRPRQDHRVGSPLVGASRLCWLVLDVDLRRPHEPWRWPSWVGLSEADLARIATLLRGNESPVWDGGSAMRAAFKSLAEVADDPNSRTLESELRVHVSRLLLAMLHDLEVRPSCPQIRADAGRHAVKQFLEELDRSIERAWTLDKMAAACGMARSQFSSRCRQLTNMSPSEYLAHRRVELAAEELRSAPHRSITDVAYQYGFSSSQYFATTFRRQKGCSPREYRADVEAVSMIGAGTTLGGGITSVIPKE